MLNEPINVTDAAFTRAVLGADLPVVAVFWSREGGYAETLREVLAATAASYAGEVRVVRLEASDAPEARARYEVDTLPQFLFLRDGRLVSRARGLPSVDALRPWVEHLLGRGPAPATRRSARPEPAASSGQPVVLSDTTFDQLVLKSNVPVLVDFWAAWCGPCRMVGPVVERLAAEFAGRALVGKLDVDANQRTAGRFGVQSIPTLIFFKGGQEVDRVVGAQPEGVLCSRLQALL
jgi:thioredoxin 1